MLFFSWHLFDGWKTHTVHKIFHDFVHVDFHQSIFPGDLFPSSSFAYKFHAFSFLCKRVVDWFSTRTSYRNMGTQSISVSVENTFKFDNDCFGGSCLGICWFMFCSFRLKFG